MNNSRNNQVIFADGCEISIKFFFNFHICLLSSALILHKLQTEGALSPVEHDHLTNPRGLTDRSGRLHRSRVRCKEE